jgi:outer membrane protein assembly factor BamB
LRGYHLLLPTLAATIGCAAAPQRVSPDLPFPLSTTWRVRPSRSTDSAAEEHPVVGPLATDGRAVFFATDTGLVCALELATGKTRWQVTLRPGAVSVADGTVFVRHSEGGVDALEAQSGETLWQSQAGSPGDLPAAPHGEQLAVLGRAATLLNARSGEKLWTTRGHGTFSTQPLFARDRLVAGTREGAIHCLALATGRPLWTFRTRAPLRATPVADDKGRVFLGTGDGRVLALSLRSGKRLWEWKTGVATNFAAVFYKDLVLFVPEDAVLLALRRNNGHLAWRATLPSRPLATPFVRGDVLISISYGSREKRTTLMAVDLVIARRLGNAFETDGEIRTAPLLLDDRLVFAFRDRSVAVMALAKVDEALGKGFARRRRMRDLGAEASPSPTPRR